MALPKRMLARLPEALPSKKDALPVLRDLSSSLREWLVHLRCQLSLTTSCLSTRIFLLGRELLMEKLKQLEARGVIGITQVADLDNVTFTDIDDPLSLLKKYYQER